MASPGAVVFLSLAVGCIAGAHVDTPHFMARGRSAAHSFPIFSLRHIIKMLSAGETRWLLPAYKFVLFIYSAGGKKEKKALA